MPVRLLDNGLQLFYQLLRFLRPVGDVFAICSSGIYGRDEYNKNFYIKWDKFKSCVYKKSLLGNLKIDNFEFSMPIITSENDIKSIIQIFDAIKSSI